MKELKNISEELFNSIFSDQRSRNAVAFAHASYDSKMILIGYVAIFGIERYIVTPEQISEAKKLYFEAKEKTFEAYKNSLIFCGMGCDYEQQYEDDICNHRIWTQIENSTGHHYLLEFSHTNDYKTYLSGYCDIDSEEKYKEDWDKLREKRDQFHSRDDEWKEINKQMQELSTQINYNSHSLMREKIDLKYTKSNVLQIVNNYFSCNFNDICIDLYNIHPSDRKIFCFSPKVKLMKITELTLF